MPPNEPTPTTTVYLVDDQTLIRAAIRSLLGQTQGVKCIGEQGDARIAIQEIARLKPDVVLLDITMPAMSGLDALPLIRSAHPAGAIVMLTAIENNASVEQAFARGANGYLSKDAPVEELILAIKTVLRGERYQSPNLGMRWP